MRECASESAARDGLIVSPPVDGVTGAGTARDAIKFTTGIVRARARNSCRRIDPARKAVDGKVVENPPPSPTPLPDDPTGAGRKVPPNESDVVVVNVAAASRFASASAFAMRAMGSAMLGCRDVVCGAAKLEGAAKGFAAVGGAAIDVALGESALTALDAAVFALVGTVAVVARGAVTARSGGNGGSDSGGCSVHPPSAGVVVTPLVDVDLFADGTALEIRTS